MFPGGSFATWGEVSVAIFCLPSLICLSLWHFKGFLGMSWTPFILSFVACRYHPPVSAGLFIPPRSLSAEQMFPW